MKKQILQIAGIIVLAFIACQTTSSDTNQDEQAPEQTKKTSEAKTPVNEPDTTTYDKMFGKLDKPLQDIVKNTQWFGQAAVKIPVKDKVIYIDPYLLPSNDKADIILITHAHGDHLSTVDINEIITEKTKIYAPKDCCEKLKASGINQYTEIEIGQTLVVDGIKISVVPAYNTDKQFHPQDNKWTGYVLTINGVKIYHPGDANRIPEMKDINCDIAFMPLGPTYTMSSVEEAAEAVLDVKAKVAIPFHYGMAEGSDDDALKFKELLNEKVAVVIKKR